MRPAGLATGVGAGRTVTSEEVMPTASFDSASAVPLAHALVNHLGASAGIRVFSIKGPTLALLGLREERLAADADIWVEPSRVDDIHAMLVEIGWRVRFESADRQARFLPAHSRTFTHPGWPCDLDVHWWFPGLGVSPGRAFEILWPCAVDAKLANQPVRVLNRPAAGLIAALHGLRHARSALHRDDLDDLATRLAACPVAEQQEFGELARQLEAVEVMAPILGRLGLSYDHQPLNEKDRRIWFEYTQTCDDGYTGAWIAQLRDARWRDRPMVLSRALWKSTADLQAASPDVKLRWPQRLRLRSIRWWSGMRHAPRAIWIVLATKEH